MLNKVLDTLLIRDGGIFLRRFHEERTLEALQFSGLPVKRPQVDEVYSELEKKYKSAEGQIIRVVFEPALPLRYTDESKVLEPLPVPLKLSAVAAAGGDGSSRFKWESRQHWADLLLQKNPDADDVLAINANDELVETSRFNIFAYDKERDVVLTPPLSSGCINGVYRRFVFSEAAIELPQLGRKVPFEEPIRFSELKYYRLFVANSVRAVLPAEFIPG